MAAVVAEERGDGSNPSGGVSGDRQQFSPLEPFQDATPQGRPKYRTPILRVLDAPVKKSLSNFLRRPRQLTVGARTPGLLSGEGDLDDPGTRFTNSMKLDSLTTRYVRLRLYHMIVECTGREGPSCRTDGSSSMLRQKWMLWTSVRLHSIESSRASNDPFLSPASSSSRFLPKPLLRFADCDSPRT